MRITESSVVIVMFPTTLDASMLISAPLRVMTSPPDPLTFRLPLAPFKLSTAPFAFGASPPATTDECAAIA